MAAFFAPQFVRAVVQPNLDACLDESGNAVGQCDCWNLPENVRFVFTPRIKLRMPASEPGCAYRGIWGKTEGMFSSWFFLDPDTGRRLATGWGHGTIGLGSHRDATECGLAGCEGCYVVTPVADPVSGETVAMRVHLEGVLLGETRSVQPDPAFEPCQAQFMIRGEILIPVDPATLLPVAPAANAPWNADFTIDGELCFTCAAAVDQCGVPAP